MYGLTTGPKATAPNLHQNLKRLGATINLSFFQLTLSTLLSQIWKTELHIRVPVYNGIDGNHMWSTDYTATFIGSDYSTFNHLDEIVTILVPSRITNGLIRGNIVGKYSPSDPEAGLSDSNADPLHQHMSPLKAEASKSLLGCSEVLPFSFFSPNTPMNLSPSVSFRCCLTASLSSLTLPGTLVFRLANEHCFFFAQRARLMLP